jgi:hypothetical protein
MEEQERRRKKGSEGKGKEEGDELLRVRRFELGTDLVATSRWEEWSCRAGVRRMGWERSGRSSVTVIYGDTGEGEVSRALPSPIEEARWSNNNKTYDV